MDTSSLMEQILSSDNLNRAYLQVVRNKGAEGMDGMKYTELKEHLEKNGEIIKEQLRTSCVIGQKRAKYVGTKICFGDKMCFVGRSK